MTGSAQFDEDDVIGDVNWRHRKLYDEAPDEYVMLSARPSWLTSTRYVTNTGAEPDRANLAKRRPMFVGKREDMSDYWDGKRRGPMFVGKRQNPLFVG